MRKTTFFLSSLFIFLIILCTCSLAYADTPKPVDILDASAIPENNEGQKHYLLVCVDQMVPKLNNLGNTDGIVMVTLDSKKNEILFTTFMREQLVQRPDGKIGRITYITKNYGIESLLDILGTHYGVKIENYMLVGWQQVANIVDAIGGVEIAMTKAEINWILENRTINPKSLPKSLGDGMYQSDGTFAMHFMRLRKVGVGDDFHRTDRVRTVLLTIAEKLKGIDMNMAMSLLDTVMENTAMTNISVMEGLEVVTTILGMDEYNLRQCQMPAKEDTSAITYVGMSTREVDFPTCRKKLSDFLYNGD